MLLMLYTILVVVVCILFLLLPSWSILQFALFLSFVLGVLYVTPTTSLFTQLRSSQNRAICKKNSVELNLNNSNIISFNGKQWVKIGHTDIFDKKTSILISKQNNFLWSSLQLPPVALFRFGRDSPIYAIQDECPHVAIGSLAEGEAASLEDIEDFSDATCNAAVSCPIHSFTFDLSTANDFQIRRLFLLICDDATIYETIISEELFPSTCVKNNETGYIWLCTKPKKRPKKRHDDEKFRISNVEGDKVQMHLVKLALQRKYG